MEAFIYIINFLENVNIYLVSLDCHRRYPLLPRSVPPFLFLLRRRVAAASAKRVDARPTLQRRADHAPDMIYGGCGFKPKRLRCSSVVQARKWLFWKLLIVRSASDRIAHSLRRFNLRVRTNSITFHNVFLLFGWVSSLTHLPSIDLCFTLPTTWCEI